MSTSNQSNGKKNTSGNNSITNTPSSTPVSTIANSTTNQAPVQSTTPPNNAPKYGTLVPNRIFVGGISANTTEAELLQLFSNYGTVKAAKIIQDRAGVSKGYGFITFESEEEAKRLQREADNIVLRERKLNIAPAIKKQPFSRAFDASSPPTITPGGPTQFFIPTGGVPFYQGGVTYYPQPPPPPGDPNTQQPPVYQPPAVYPAQSGPPQTAAYPSIVYPTQPLYMPQQFPYQPVPYDFNYYANGGPQYMVGNQGIPQPQAPTMQPPGSPPRTPCFNPPMPYNPEAMYYNMPMYGGPVETTTVYQDSMDMANGNLTEDSYGYIGGFPHELEQTLPSSNTSEFTNSNSSIDTTRQSATPVVSLLALDQHQEKDINSLQSGRRRKSVDSVTSVNNAGHQQLAPNGFVSTLFPNHHNHPPLNMPFPNIHNPPPILSGNTFNGCVPFGVPPPLPPDFFAARFPPNNMMPKLPNSPNNRDRSTWYYNNRRPARYSDNRSNSEGVSNPRTESNSSASLVDENRNEEKQLNPTPPTAYSPVAQHGFNGGNKYVTRNFHNHLRTQPRGNFHNFCNNNSRSYNSYVGGANKMPPQIRKTNVRTNFEKKQFGNNSSKVEEGCNRSDIVETLARNEAVNVTNSTFLPKTNNVAVEAPNVNAGNFISEPPVIPSTNYPVSINPQIPTSSGPSQNFIPPIRRTRRSARRSTHAGTPSSEIGAGDAPLPSAEVADTCKKLDNLKL